MATDDREAVLEEHREISSCVARIEEQLMRPAIGGWPATLADRLDELSTLLRAHFSGEAEASFFREVITIAPHLQARLSALALEHGKILQALSKASSLARTPDAAARGLLLRRKVQLTLATLRRHESEENEMIMRAYLRDLGASD